MYITTEEQVNERVSPSYLKYLNTEQALEDIAHFIQEYKENDPQKKNIKVAVFGCSYMGTLATWLRYKFPHLVDAAWANNAPLNITLEYAEYYETAEKTYIAYSKSCFEDLVKLYRTYAMKKGLLLQYIREFLLPQWDCIFGQAKALEYFRQVIFDQHYLQPNQIKKLCGIIDDTKQRSTVYPLLLQYLARHSHRICINESETNANEYLERYQRCTEFGHSLTSSKSQLFGNLTQYSEVVRLLQSCNQEFPLPFQLTEADVQYNIRRKNRLYSSKDLQVTQMIFMYGENDPWRNLGYGRENGYNVTWKLVNDTFHCREMFSHELNFTFPTTNLEKVLANGLNEMKKWLRD